VAGSAKAFQESKMAAHTLGHVEAAAADGTHESREFCSTIIAPVS
jgi:hypothetical protein